MNFTNGFWSRHLSIKLCRPILVKRVLQTYCEFTSARKVEETFACNVSTWFCKLSPLEAFAWNVKICFLGKIIIKNISICPQLKDLPSMLRVNFNHFLGKFSRQHTETVFLFFTENRIWHFMQIVFIRENSCEMSNPFSFEKKKQNKNNPYIPENRICHFMQIRK